MEQSKLSQLISLFGFVKGGMLQVDKTWDNFEKLYTFYQKNKNMIIKHSNYRVIIDNNEYEISKVNVKPSQQLELNFKLLLIAAMDNNNLIGIGDNIPWKISEDMKRFKKQTMGCPMIMGRKTFETFPKPLPGRKHLIITRNLDYKFPDNGVDYTNCEIFTSVPECLKYINSLNLTEEQKVYVIGGGEIYKQTIDFATELDITRVVEIIDTTKSTEKLVYFPFLESNKWKIDDNFINFEGKYEFHFRKYVKSDGYVDSSIKLSETVVKQILISYGVKNR